MRRACIQSLAFIVLFATTALADDKSPLVKIITPQGTGTGSVVSILENKPVADGFEGYILTAYHVIAPSAANSKRDISIAYENGRIAEKCQVVAFNKEADIALIWAWVPEEVIVQKIAARPAAYNDALMFIGLGGGIKITDENEIRRISGKASVPTHPDRLYSDTVLIPGDSGGPVLNDDKKLVGVISGGWFWYRTEENKQKRTWPARATNTKPIIALLEALEAGTPTPEPKDN